MDKEQQLYLPPNEQLIIGAKVNRLCEVSVEEFDPESQVRDAEEIIRALHPRMKPTNNSNLEVNMTHKGASKMMAGETGFGQVNTSFDSTEIKNFRVGIEEYRIGGYISTLQNYKTFSVLIFEHFWDRGVVGEVFEQKPMSHCISFESDYKVQTIYREWLSIDKLFWIISRITNHQLDLYPEKGKLHSYNSGISINIRV